MLDWLPSISLPSVSFLPANLQRRLLSFILRKALGRFVRGGELDLDKVDAQISKGTVEIKDVELDGQAIDELLAPLPLTLSSGTLGRAHLQIPFPSLRSGPSDLCLSIEDLALVFVLSPSSTSTHVLSSSGVAQATLARPGFDLAESVASLADGLLHDEQEGKELERSLRASLQASSGTGTGPDGVGGDFPGAFDSPSLSSSPPPPSAPSPSGRSDQPGSSAAVGAEEVTFLAGIIERLLARLRVSVRNVSARIIHEPDASSSSVPAGIAQQLEDQTERDGVEMEVKIAQILFVGDDAGDPTASSDGSPVEDAPSRGPGDIARLLRIVGFQLWMRPIPLLRSSSPSFTRSSSSRPFGVSQTQSPTAAPVMIETNEEENDETDEEEDDENETETTLMSQGVADLRPSVTTDASGHSIFVDAPEERTEEENVPEEGGKEERPADVKDNVGSLVEEKGNPSFGHQAVKDGRPPLEQGGTSATSARDARRDGRRNVLLLASCVDGDIEIRLSTSSRSRPFQTASSSDDTSAGGSSASTRPAPRVARRPETSVDVFFPSLKLLVLPWQARCLVRFLDDATASFSKAKDSPPSPSMREHSKEAAFRTSVHVASLYAVLVYEDSRELELDQLDAHVERYWTSEQDVPLGQLRLLLEEATASHLVLPSSSSSIAGSRTESTTAFELRVENASLHERLPPSVCRTLPSDAPHIVPVILFDETLSDQYRPPVSFIPSPHRRSSPSATSPRQGSSRRSGKAAAAPKDGATAEFCEASFPSIASDWRRSAVVEGGVRELLGLTKERNPVVDGSWSDRGRAGVALLPVHVLADVSLADRVLPFLTSFRVPVADDWAVGTLSVDALHLDDPPPLPTNNPGGTSPKANPEVPSGVVPLLTCPLLRVSVRVPAPIKSADAGDRRRKRGRGLDLRSGVISVDLHHVKAVWGAEDERHGGAPKGKGKAKSVSFDDERRKDADEERMAAVEVAAALLFFRGAHDSQAAALLVSLPISSPDPFSSDAPLHPSLVVSSRPVSPSGAFSDPSTRRLISVSLPSLHLTLFKAVLDGLQLFADDLAQWFEAWTKEAKKLTNENEDGSENDMRMLGSRFFGPHATFSLDGSRLGEEESGDTTARLDVSETEIMLMVPTDENGERVRRVRASASDLSVAVATEREGQNSTTVELRVLDLDLQDLSMTEEPGLFYRTLERDITQRPRPMLVLKAVSSADLEFGLKESAINAKLADFTFVLRTASGLFKDLAEYSRSPEGAFENVPPSEVTRLSATLLDGSVLAIPSDSEARLAATFTKLSYACNLIPDAPSIFSKLGSLSLGLFLLEDNRNAERTEERADAPDQHWKNLGFARMLELVEFDASIRTSTGWVRPQLDLEINRANVIVTACADSLAVLPDVLSSFLPPAPPPSRSQPVPRRSKKAPSSTSLSSSRSLTDLLASLDDDAFRGAAPIPSAVDMVEDDLPEHPDYMVTPIDSPMMLADGGHEHEEGYATDDSSISVLAPPQRDHFVSVSEDVTVRILHPDGVNLVDDYFDESNLAVEEALSAESRVSLRRVRVHDCNVTVRLHGGYDWQKTRWAIEEERKAVRRRLQKIRQLLAEGQTPDESAENMMSSVLFESVHIGLPDEVSDMEPAEIIHAIDDELGQGSETASQASTFQPLHRTEMERQPSQASRALKRLARSRDFSIEINLRGVELEWNAYELGHSDASCITVDVREFDIIDNIKTSTWRKFLTDMRPSGSTIRETDSKMAKVELKMVRPIPGQPTEEARLRVRVAPLRLHVDQDALDFLKAFFAFKDPQAAAKNAVAAKDQTFIQMAEIFAVRLKLDYKPKRVNYRQLKEGKTIELMNFFHFDGVEMTLRHITLRGVSGWQRLSDALQDIWTPDVKANQLADVLSGLSPVRSLVNLGSGFANLVLLPVEQYQRDRRLARGVQKGATSFAKTTAMEAIKLGAKLATGTQVILEQAETVLGGRVDRRVHGETVAERSSGTSASAGDAGTASEALESEMEEMISKYAHQPADVREGLKEAYQSLSKNLNAAAQTILALPMEVYERTGSEGTSRPVVRAVPIAILKPMIGASEAMSKALFGLHNQLDPGSRSDNADKYKSG